MHLALDLSHMILRELAALRRENKDITYLRPDSKSQVTIEYSDDNVPQSIDTSAIWVWEEEQLGIQTDRLVDLQIMIRP